MENRPLRFQERTLAETSLAFAIPGWARGRRTLFRGAFIGLTIRATELNARRVSLQQSRARLDGPTAKRAQQKRGNNRECHEGLHSGTVSAVHLRHNSVPTSFLASALFQRNLGNSRGFGGVQLPAMQAQSPLFALYTMIAYWYVELTSAEKAAIWYR